MLRSLFASTCLTPIAIFAIALPLHAETLVDLKRTTPIATAAAEAGTADDIRITGAALKFAEFSAEQQQGRAAVAVRASVTFAL